MQVNNYNEVLPRLELGLPDSKSEVLTNYTIEPHSWINISGNKHMYNTKGTSWLSFCLI